MEVDSGGSIFKNKVRTWTYYELLLDTVVQCERG